MLSDEKRREIEEVRHASNSPNDDDIYCRYRDVRVGGLPSDIDSRALQTGKLRDGRLVMFVRSLTRGSRTSRLLRHDALRINVALSVLQAHKFVFDRR